MLSDVQVRIKAKKFARMVRDDIMAHQIPSEGIDAMTQKQCEDYIAILRGFNLKLNAKGFWER